MSTEPPNYLMLPPHEKLDLLQPRKLLDHFRETLDHLCRMGEKIRRRSISPLPHHSKLSFLAYHALSSSHMAPNSGSPVQNVATFDIGQPSITTPPNWNPPYVSNSSVPSTTRGNPQPKFLYLPWELFLVWGKVLL